MSNGPEFINVLSDIYQRCGLVQIEKLKSSIEDMPINASLLNSLRETALLTATHYSTQIDGNLRTLPEVDKVKALHALVMTGKARSSPYRSQQNVIRESGSGRIVYLPPEPMMCTDGF
jgi:hypothetical protein